MAIQATLASIQQPKVHAAIQAHDNAALNLGLNDEPGQLLLHFLGINEWFSVYHAAGCIETDAALLKLNTFIADLNCMESIDEDELGNSRILELAAKWHVFCHTRITSIRGNLCLLPRQTLLVSSRIILSSIPSGYHQRNSWPSLTRSKVRIHLRKTSMTPSLRGSPSFLSTHHDPLSGNHPKWTAACGASPTLIIWHPSLSKCGNRGRRFL